jgi:hypothetical protein
MSVLRITSLPRNNSSADIYDPASVSLGETLSFGRANNRR